MLEGLNLKFKFRNLSEKLLTFAIPTILFTNPPLLLAKPPLFFTEPAVFFTIGNGAVSGKGIEFIGGKVRFEKWEGFGGERECGV